MQESTNYPLRREHKKMHDDFVITIRKLRSEYYENGADTEMLMKITMIVLTWLNEHIYVHDREFGVFFKNNRKNFGKLQARDAEETGVSP